MHTRHIAALFRTQRMMGRHNRAKQWTGPPRVRDQTNSSHPSPTRCCRSLLQRARDTHAAYHNHPPSFQKCMARAPVSPCAPPRVFRGKNSSWGHGEISRIHEPCRADEAARLMKRDKGSGASATAPGRQPSMGHGSRGCLILREVQGRYWPYGVDWGCGAVLRAPIMCDPVTRPNPDHITCPRRISCDDRQGLLDRCSFRHLTNSSVQ